MQNAVSQGELGVATATNALFRSMGGALGIALLSSILFALLHGQPATGGLEHHAAASASMLPGSAAPPGQAEFAFRITFLVATLVALFAHALAWAIPDHRLRERVASQPAAASATEH